jgi:hypothetical protein
MSNETRLERPIRELLCQRCNQEYPVWYAPNELWNLVQQEDEHFFCPTCFAILAEERGIRTTAWKLMLETEQDLAVQGEISTLKAECAALEKENAELIAEQLGIEGRCPVGHNKKFTYELKGQLGCVACEKAALEKEKDEMLVHYNVMVKQMDEDGYKISRLNEQIESLTKQLAEAREVDELIKSIRTQGYGIKLSCWKQGSWTCQIWEGSPVDRSEKVVVTIAGQTIKEALKAAIGAAGGKAT